MYKGCKTELGRQAWHTGISISRKKVEQKDFFGICWWFFSLLFSSSCCCCCGSLFSSNLKKKNILFLTPLNVECVWLNASFLSHYHKTIWLWIVNVLKLRVSAGVSTFQSLLFPFISAFAHWSLLLFGVLLLLFWDKIGNICEAEAVHYVCSLLSLRDSR